MTNKIITTLASLLVLYNIPNSGEIKSSFGKIPVESIEKKVITKPGKSLDFDAPQLPEPGINLNALRGKITYVFENETSFMLLQSSITNRGSYIKAEYNRGNTRFDVYTDIKIIKFWGIVEGKRFLFPKPKITGRFKVTFPLYLPF